MSHGDRAAALQHDRRAIAFQQTARSAHSSRMRGLFFPGANCRVKPGARTPDLTTSPPPSGTHCLSRAILPKSASMPETPIEFMIYDLRFTRRPALTSSTLPFGHSHAHKRARKRNCRRTTLPPHRQAWAWIRTEFFDRANKFFHANSAALNAEVTGGGGGGSAFPLTGNTAAEDLRQRILALSLPRISRATAAWLTNLTATNL